MPTIYTIGHSTRTLDELIAALQTHGIRTLVDIRAFPMSRRLPHFNRESLELELPKRGIAYVWMKELGGRRKKILDDSPNTGLRNDAFRNYADYMLTAEFAEGIERLLQIAEQEAGPSATAAKGGPPTLGMTKEEGRPPTLGMTNEEGRPRALGMTMEPSGSTAIKSLQEPGNVAIMCAERMYFQCHRMLVSDYLTAHGHTVLHIEDEKRPLRPHKLMAEAHLVDGQLLYNVGELF
ncbi:MAG: DUF488 domain-containing protein [Candidatus Korobacteraceae bacterium]